MSDRLDAGSGSLLGRLRDRLEGPNTIGGSAVFWVGFAVAVAALIAYPQTTDPYTVIQSSRYLALAFLALSLCFIWGYAGVLSFGQVAFFGVAAYAFGVIGINLSSATGVVAATSAPSSRERSRRRCWDTSCSTAASATPT
nr:hypothetical protein [Halorubrum saccharovorum]